MLGKISTFDNERNEGEIVGEDKVVYPFHIGEWLSNRNISVGQNVYYEVAEDEARNIINTRENKKYVLHLKIDVSILE